MKGIRFGFKTMLRIDHFVGLPLCFFISIWASLVKLLSFRKRSLLPERPRRILILKWFGMGSIVLAKDLVYSIRARYPKAKVVFLTFNNQLGLIKTLDLTDEVLIVRKDTPLVFLIDAFKMLISLSLKKIDITIDLEYYSKFSAIVSYLSGAPLRVGFYLPSFWREALFTHLVYFNYFRHIKETYKMVGKTIDVAVKDEQETKIDISQDELNMINDKLVERGWNESDKLIGINPNAGELAHCRRWPKEYFVEVIKEIAKRSGLEVILLGSKDDKRYVEKIYEALGSEVRKKVLNLAGVFNIQQLIGLINNLKLLITNDSGPFHLAVIQGIPTISIWGPSATWLYGAQDKTKHKEFYSDIECSPCMGVYRAQAGMACNQEIPCLKGILPGDVIKSALKII